MAHRNDKRGHVQYVEENGAYVQPRLHMLSYPRCTILKRTWSVFFKKSHSTLLCFPFAAMVMHLL